MELKHYLQCVGGQPLLPWQKAMVYVEWLYIYLIAPFSESIKRGVGESIVCEQSN